MKSTSYSCTRWHNKPQPDYPGGEGMWHHTKTMTFKHTVLYGNRQRDYSLTNSKHCLFMLCYIYTITIRKLLQYSWYKKTVYFLEYSTVFTIETKNTTVWILKDQMIVYLACIKTEKPFFFYECDKNPGKGQKMTKSNIFRSFRAFLLNF